MFRCDSLSLSLFTGRKYESHLRPQKNGGFQQGDEGDEKEKRGQEREGVQCIFTAGRFNSAIRGFAVIHLALFPILIEYLAAGDLFVILSKTPTLGAPYRISFTGRTSLSLSLSLSPLPDVALQRVYFILTFHRKICI